MADSYVEIASICAALASAIAGAFSAFGAMKSASIARVAQETIVRSEKRISLKDLVVTNKELDIEIKNARARSSELKRACQALAVWTNTTSNSRLKLMLDTVDKKISVVDIAVGQLGVGPVNMGSMFDASLDDINTRLAKITEVLMEVRSIREGFDAELERVELESSSLSKTSQL